MGRQLTSQIDLDQAGSLPHLTPSRDQGTFVAGLYWISPPATTLCSLSDWQNAHSLTFTAWLAHRRVAAALSPLILHHRLISYGRHICQSGTFLLLWLCLFTAGRRGLGPAGGIRWGNGVLGAVSRLLAGATYKGNSFHPPVYRLG